MPLQQAERELLIEKEPSGKFTSIEEIGGDRSVSCAATRPRT